MTTPKVNTPIPTDLYRYAVGLDKMFDTLNYVRHGTTNNYPPYNVVQLSEDEYEISLAVAGFSLDNLSVTKEKNILTIEGKSNTVEDEVNYLYKGLSNREFKRDFQLADYVDISSAKLELGILIVNLKREVPEEQKPRTIEISQK